MNRTLSKLGVKELRDGLTYKIIKEKFSWILKAQISGAEIGMKEDKLVWYFGFWNGGTWKDGIWRDGIWNNGFWRVGTWKSGWFFKGEMDGGVVDNIEVWDEVILGKVSFKNLFVTGNVISREMSSADKVTITNRKKSHKIVNLKIKNLYKSDGLERKHFKGCEIDLGVIDNAILEDCILGKNVVLKSKCKLINSHRFSEESYNLL